MDIIDYSPVIPALILLKQASTISDGQEGISFLWFIITMLSEHQKHSPLTFIQLQQIIDAFIWGKQKEAAKMPQQLSEGYPHQTVVIVAVLLPSLKFPEITTSRSKEAIVRIISSAITKPEQSVSEILQFFMVNCSEDAYLSEIRVSHSPVGMISKLINLPSLFYNLTGRLTDASAMPSQKDYLYKAILSKMGSLPSPDQISIINRLLTLHEQHLVIGFYLQSNTQFFKENFNLLNKKAAILKELFKRMVTQENIQVRSFIQKLASGVVQKHEESHEAILSILSMNQNTYYCAHSYSQFYQAFCRSGGSRAVMEELLKWWAVGRNFIITKVHAKFRCNLLALLIEDTSKEKLISEGYIVSITEGIKKRLTDGSCKEYASLIWKTLGKKLDLNLSVAVSKADYFEIESQQKRINKEEAKFITHSPTQITAQESESQSDGEQAISVNDSSDLGVEIAVIEPKNIYDCILGIRNANRRRQALKKLPQIIRRYRQDLVLMWSSLLKELLSPIEQDHIPVLKQLFTDKPQDFVEALCQFMMNRPASISEKIHLLEIVAKGVEELSEAAEEEEKDESVFYFKKIKSKYYKQQGPKNQNEGQVLGQKERTRRWGYTRIEHEKSKSSVSLDFLKKERMINRFYPIANLLYFKILDPLSSNLIGNLKQYQVYTHQLLKTLAVFLSNLTNHHEKYIIMEDISEKCELIAQELLKASKAEMGSDRHEETGGQTLLLTLQVVNKISLAADQFLPQRVLQSLRKIVELSRKLPNYGMSSVLDMIEANIYRKVYHQSFL